MVTLTATCMGCKVRGDLIFNRVFGCRCKTAGTTQTNAPAPTPGNPAGVVPARASPRGRRRAGNPAVDALVAGLAARNVPLVGNLDPDRVILPLWILVREYAWALDVGREFRADLAFPALRLLIEVKGGAHAAGRAKQRADVEREGMAVSMGYRVLPLTPEQAKSEEGVDLVLRTWDEALAALVCTLRSPAGGLPRV